MQDTRHNTAPTPTPTPTPVIGYEIKADMDTIARSQDAFYKAAQATADTPMLQDQVDQLALELTQLKSNLEQLQTQGRARAPLIKAASDPGQQHKAAFEQAQAAEGGAIVTLFEPPPAGIARVGDRLLLYAGCDKRFTTCQTRFDNALNFEASALCQALMPWCAMAQAEAFVQAARCCVGARFRLQGRDPRFGLDCVGVIVWAAQAVGIMVNDQADYTLNDDPARLTRALQETGWRVKPGLECAAGDVGLFSSGGALRHLGVLTPNSLIHADIGLRCVVEHGFDALWRARLHRLYQIF